MPRLDGTGPNGQGPMTGRGMGNCKAVNGEERRYYGKVFFGRRCGKGKLVKVQNENDINFLKAQAEDLKSRLEEINKILDSAKNEG